MIVCNVDGLGRVGMGVMSPVRTRFVMKMRDRLSRGFHKVDIYLKETRMSQ
jgi:hypothetical protein